MVIENMDMEDTIEMNENESELIDIVSLIQAIYKSMKRLKVIILAITIVVSSMYCFYQYMKYTPTYNTRVTFSVVKNTDPTFYYNIDATEQAKEVFEQILQSQLLLNIISEDLNVSSLPGYYRCTAVEDTNLLVVNAYSTNSNYSYQMIESLINNYDQVSQLILSDVRLNVIGQYERSVDPINSFDWIKTIATGLLLSVALNMGIIGLYVTLRKTIQKEEDIKKQLNTRCLTTLPKIPDKKRSMNTTSSMLLGIGHLPHSFIEGIRLLRHKIESDAKRHKNQVYVFSSTVPSEGKTSISANVAIALANKDKKVVLVDCDFRKPSMQGKFNISLTNSLEQVIEKKCTLQDALTKYNEHLYLLGNKQSVKNPTEALSSYELKSIIRSLRESFDYIIIDTPPSKEMSDASIVARYGDASIMIIREDSMPIKDIMDAMETFVSYSHNLLGCVLNFSERKSDRVYKR